MSAGGDSMAAIRKFFTAIAAGLTVAAIVLLIGVAYLYCSTREKEMPVEAVEAPVVSTEKEEKTDFNVQMEDNEAINDGFTVVDDAYKYKELEKALEEIKKYTDEQLEVEDEEIDETAEGYIPNEP